MLAYLFTLDFAALILVPLLLFILFIFLFLLLFLVLVLLLLVLLLSRGGLLQVSLLQARINQVGRLATSR